MRSLSGPSTLSALGSDETATEQVAAQLDSADVNDRKCKSTGQLSLLSHRSACSGRGPASLASSAAPQRPTGISDQIGHVQCGRQRSQIQHTAQLVLATTQLVLAEVQRQQPSRQWPPRVKASSPNNSSVRSGGSARKSTEPFSISPRQRRNVLPTCEAISAQQQLYQRGEQRAQIKRTAEPFLLEPQLRHCARQGKEE